MAKIKTQLSFSENGSDAGEDSDPSSTTEPSPDPAEEARDEVKEVKELAKKETNRVRLWRFVVTGALLATSLAVTLVSFRFLQKEESAKFHTAVSITKLTTSDDCRFGHDSYHV